jgi:hypothetical protein
MVSACHPAVKVRYKFDGKSFPINDLLQFPHLDCHFLHDNAVIPPQGGVIDAEQWFQGAPSWAAAISLRV